AERDALVEGRRHGTGEHETGDVVAALGHADREVSRRLSVELGGSTGARAAPTGGPLELDLQQPGGLGPGAMEAGHVGRHPHCGRRLFTPHRGLLFGDVAIEGQTGRVVEGGDSSDRGAGVLGAHRLVAVRELTSTIIPRLAGCVLYETLL